MASYPETGPLGPLIAQGLHWGKPRRRILVRERDVLKRLFLAGVLALLLIRAPFPAPASSPQASQAEQAAMKPIQHEVSVVLKLIHVYVTDKKDKPVTDLTMSDFTVTDNGQPVTLTDFEKRILRAAAGEPEEGKPDLGTAEPAAPAAPALRQTGRKFFFFFDYAFNNARGIVKARTAALHFLDSEVRPDDEIGILSYSMLKGLTVHEYLTRDKAKVREVVEGIGSKDVAGRASEMESWYWRVAGSSLSTDAKASGEGAQGGPDPNLSTSGYAYEVKAQREEAKRIAELYMTRLTALAKSMRFVDGQKHFIMFSSGLPTSLVYGAQSGNPSQTAPVGSWGSNRLDIGDSVLKSLNEAMTKEFAAAGCALFSFDTRESAKGTDLFAWDTIGLEAGGRTVLTTQGVFSDSTSLFKDDKATGLDYLKRMSDQTGGRYFSNINRYEKNLDQVQALTGTYYVLGYPISERWDGKFHEIKVEVGRKGCEVRAQAGYFNPKPFSEYSTLERQLHLFDLALNERALSRLPDKVPMTALSSAAEGIARLAVLAKLPGEVTAKFSGQRLEFVAIFFDARGEISNMVREEVDPASIRGRDMAFAAGSILKPGEYACRLVVRDMDSGMSAVGSAKATIGKPLVTGLDLGTPLVLEPRTGCSLVSAGGGKGKSAFLWADLYPYDSALFSPVLAGLPAAAGSLQVVMPCAYPGAGQTELAVSANLVNAATGERSPVTIARLDRAPKGPHEVLTLEIPMAAVPPGTYYLHFYAQDRTTGSLGHSFAALVVPKR